MPKSIPAEWLLARSVGPTQAAAIMGDLTEMAATRGRLWFLAAYLRTLLNLTWRTPVAFVAAIAGFKFLFPMTVRGLGMLLHSRHHLSDPGLFGAWNPFSVALFSLSLATAFTLFFAFPYVLLRFGVHDRLTILAGALFLLTIPIYTRLPWVRDISGLLTALVILTALALPRWRRPLIVLAATCAAPLAAVRLCSLIGFFQSQNPFALSIFGVSLAEVCTVAIVAILCPLLHRRLLEPHPPSIQPAGGAHA